MLPATRRPPRTSSFPPKPSLTTLLPARGTSGFLGHLWLPRNDVSFYTVMTSPCTDPQGSGSGEAGLSARNRVDSNVWETGFLFAIKCKENCSETGSCAGPCRCESLKGGGNGIRPRRHTHTHVCLYTCVDLCARTRVSLFMYMSARMNLCVGVHESVCVYSRQPLMGIMCGVSSRDTQKHANPQLPCTSRINTHVHAHTHTHTNADMHTNTRTQSVPQSAS